MRRGGKSTSGADSGISAGGLYIANAWTQAGCGSSVHVKGSTKNDNFLFDCGVWSHDFIAACAGIKAVFISHGHTDHVGAAAMLVRYRSMNNGKKKSTGDEEKDEEDDKSATSATATRNNNKMEGDIATSVKDGVEVKNNRSAKPSYLAMLKAGGGTDSENDKSAKKKPKYVEPALETTIIHDNKNGLVIYAPYDVIEPLTAAITAFQTLDGAESLFSYTIIPMKPGDTVKIGNNYLIQAIETIHRVQSQGYVIYQETKGKLFDEYMSCTKQELNELRDKGVKYKHDDNTEPVLAYTGDTVFEGLLKPENSVVFQVPVLMLEVTYLDREYEKATARGHVHINDIINNAELFENQAIVFVHISSRYGGHVEVVRIIREALTAGAPQLLDKVYMSLRMFGKDEGITKLTKIDTEKYRKSPGHGWSK